MTAPKGDPRVERALRGVWQRAEVLRVRQREAEGEIVAGGERADAARDLLRALRTPFGRLAEIADAIGRTDERLALVFRMHYAAGKTYKQVAASFDTSAATIHRLRRRLVDELASNEAILIAIERWAGGDDGPTMGGYHRQRSGFDIGRW